MMFEVSGCAKLFCQRLHHGVVSAPDCWLGVLFLDMGERLVMANEQLGHAVASKLVLVLS